MWVCVLIIDFGLHLKTPFCFLSNFKGVRDDGGFRCLNGVYSFMIFDTVCFVDNSLPPPSSSQVSHDVLLLWFLKSLVGTGNETLKTEGV